MPRSGMALERRLRRKSGVGHRRCSAGRALDSVLILSHTAKTLSWSSGQSRHYCYWLAAPG
jgi:hypothetical protein